MRDQAIPESSSLSHFLASERWCPLLVVAAGTIAHLNGIKGEFHLDDTIHIVGNRAIRTFPPSGLSPNRSLVVLSIAANYALGGLDVVGYHLFNLAVHLAAALVLYALVRGVLLRERADGPLRTYAAPLACVIALLWAVHPLQTQSVTYIIQRAESMAGLFFLLSLYGLLRGSDSPGKGRLAWYGLSIASEFFGLASKEVAATIPVIALAFDRIFLSSSWRELWLRRWGYYLGLGAPLIMAVPAATLIFAKNEVGVGIQGNAGVGPLQYAAAQPGVLLHYLRLAFWPTPLCIDHQWTPPETFLEFFIPAAAILGILGLTVWLLRRYPKVGFLGIAFFVVLLPTSSFIPIADLAVEHRMYLPLAAVLTAAAIAGFLGLQRLHERGTFGAASPFAVGTGFVAVVAIAFCLLTQQRNEEFQSPDELWKSALRMYPNHPRAHVVVGVKLMRRQRYAEAIDHLEKATRLAPEYPLAFLNLATALSESNRLSEAETIAQRALRLDPNSYETRHVLGVISRRMGKTDDAIARFEEALRLNPEAHWVWNSLGAALISKEEYQKAEAKFLRAIELEPTYLKAHQALGKICIYLKRYDEAEKRFRRAVELAPTDAGTHADLAHALALQRQPEAASQYRDATALDPDWILKHSLGAWRFATSPNVGSRNGAEALRLAEQVVQADGTGDAKFLDVLAAAYAELGQFDRAIATAIAAVAKAEADRESELVAEIRQRLALYEKGQPFRAETAEAPTAP